MEPPNPVALKQLDRMLSDKLNTLTVTGSVDVGGIDSLVKIMRGVGRNSERSILQRLDVTNPELSEEIKSRMFVFEDIVLLDNKSIQKVLKDVSMSILALALKKTPQDIVDLILNNLSERAKAVLMEDINSMGKVPLKDVEMAQQEIVEIIRRMEEAGEVTIRKEEEVYV
jgi:flagellar motor switch protein FliG